MSPRSHAEVILHLPAVGDGVQPVNIILDILRVGMHRAKLVNIEGAPVTTDPGKRYYHPVTVLVDRFGLRATLCLDAQHIPGELLLFDCKACTTQPAQRLGPGEGRVGAAGEELPETPGEPQSRDHTVDQEVGQVNQVINKW